MGKSENLQQEQRQQGHHESGRNQGSSIFFFCERCSMGLSRILKEFNVKCVVVLILSLCVLLSGIFWILPFNHKRSGFDAKDEVKLSATVQASFRLQRPVLELIPHIGRLEYDIFGEIGVPDTKVAILSMHQPGASNWTDVVFGVLSDPINLQINPVSLSVLRSSLIELFLQQSNLTLTASIFGQPFMFEILKFPGGITVIPMQSVSIWQMPQILFNFTLNNSISDIEDKLIELKDQLKFGLGLQPYENVYVQLTNSVGSTINSPVIVQASVMSDLGGSLLPPRLKQLAQTITDSPGKNLGLDNSVFGKVKSINLSSYLTGTLHANPPTPSPAPSPEPLISPYPALSPSHPPGPSPAIHHHPPCLNCRASPPSQHSHLYAPSPLSWPSPSFPPTSASPAPSTIPTHPPQPCPYHGPSIPPSSSPTPKSNPTPYSPPMSPPSQSPRAPSPLPEVSFGSRRGQDIGSAEGPMAPSLAPSLAPSPSSSAISPFYKEARNIHVNGTADELRVKAKMVAGHSSRSAFVKYGMFFPKGRTPRNRVTS